MRFNYVATGKDGKIERGVAIEDDVKGVLRFLTTRGLKPVSVEKSKMSLLRGRF